MGWRGKGAAWEHSPHPHGIRRLRGSGRGSRMDGQGERNQSQSRQREARTTLVIENSAPRVLSGLPGMLGPRVPVLLALLNRRPKVTLPLWISVSSPIIGCPCSGGSWQQGYQASSVTAAQHSTHQSLQTRGGLVTTSRSFPLQVGMPNLTDK